MTSGGQESIEEIGEQEGSIITDVTEIVDSGTTRIDVDCGCLDGLKGLELVCQCVVERYFQNNKAY